MLKYNLSPRSLKDGIFSQTTGHGVMVLGLRFFSLPGLKAILEITLVSVNISHTKMREVARILRARYAVKSESGETAVA